MRNIFKLTSDQTNIKTMADLYSTIYADQNLGRELPSQYTETDDKNIRYIFEYYNTLIFDDNFAKILSTPYLESLVNKL